MKYSASKNDFFVTRSILETHNHLDMFFHFNDDTTIYLFVKQFIYKSIRESGDDYSQRFLILTVY